MTARSVDFTTTGDYVGILEFQSPDGEWHDFTVIRTPSGMAFGGACNTGFLTSGSIAREDGETDDTLLGELLADLEVYYRDGAAYTSRIATTERM